MAPSLPRSLALAFSLFRAAAQAATVTYNFSIDWVHANPDGQFVRPVIGVNGKWPIPPIVATKGDRVVVNVKNNLGNETTSLHFHGLYQNGTTHMDGAASVTQCDIFPGSSLTYNFTVDQPGTYWYHSHSKGQYPDGLRGPLIVHDPEMPFADQYDEEVVLTFSDWYHDLMRPLLAGFIRYSNPTGAEPVPQSALMNDTQNLTISIEPGKTYLFRIINIGAFAAQYVWFEGHTMRIVEVDGIYTEPAEADMIYMTAAQRYSVLVTAKNDTNANFAIVGSMDQDLFDTVPDGLNSNVTGWLVYDKAKELPAPAAVDEYAPFDDFSLVPHDGELLYENVDVSYTLDLKMDNLGDGANYAFFNDITYVQPRVPTLYTALTAPSHLAANATVYSPDTTNAMVIAAGQVVEIVLNNNDPGKHPFHLHGHAFQLVIRADDEVGPYTPDVPGAVPAPASPMRRDVVLVRPNSHLALRFRADNPGIWLFHCHIEWHVASGLVATFVEAPDLLRAQLAGKIPEDHLRACRDAGVPVAGNAAGNGAGAVGDEAWFDMAGVPAPPARLPEGFTGGGIAALVVSTLVGLVGVGVVAWYGMAGGAESAKASS